MCSPVQRFTFRQSFLLNPTTASRYSSPNELVWMNYSRLFRNKLYWGTNWRYPGCKLALYWGTNWHYTGGQTGIILGDKLVLYWGTDWCYTGGQTGVILGDKLTASHCLALVEWACFRECACVRALYPSAYICLFPRLFVCTCPSVCPSVRLRLMRNSPHSSF